MHFTLKEDIFTKEGGTLFPVTFYFKDFFPQDFLEYNFFGCYSIQ